METPIGIFHLPGISFYSVLSVSLFELLSGQLSFPSLSPSVSFCLCQLVSLCLTLPSLATAFMLLFFFVFRNIVLVPIPFSPPLSPLFVPVSLRCFLASFSPLSFPSLSLPSVSFFFSRQSLFEGHVTSGARACGCVYIFFSLLFVLRNFGGILPMKPIFPNMSQSF